MMAQKLGMHLIALERLLHGLEVRKNRVMLEELLHPCFKEFGRSGLVYSRSTVIDALLAADEHPDVWSQDFEIAVMDERAVLLTYRSAHIDRSGELTRHTNRSSVWRYLEDRWQMWFHQGTPTEGFAKTDPNLIIRTDGPAAEDRER